MRYKLYSYHQSAPRNRLYPNSGSVKSKDEIDGFGIEDDIFVNTIVYEGKVVPNTLRISMPENHPLFNINIAYTIPKHTRGEVNVQFQQFQKDVSHMITPFTNMLDKVIKDKQHYIRALDITNEI